MQRPARRVSWLRSVLLPATAGCLIFAAAIASRAATIPGGGLLPFGEPPAVDCYAFANVAGNHEILNGKQLACTDGDPTCDQDGACNGSCRFRAQLCFGLRNNPACTPLPTVDSLRISKNCPLTAPATLAGSACGAFVEFDVALKGAAGQRAAKRRCVTRTRAPQSVSDRTDTDVFGFKCVPPRGGCQASPSGAFF